MPNDLTEQTMQELHDDQLRLGYGEEIAKMDVALALIEARKKYGVTQQQLAESLGVTQAYIARLESGNANPTIATVGRIFAKMWSRPSWNGKPLVAHSKIVNPRVKSTTRSPRRTIIIP